MILYIVVRVNQETQEKEFYSSRGIWSSIKSDRVSARLYTRDGLAKCVVAHHRGLTPEYYYSIENFEIKG